MTTDDDSGSVSARTTVTSGGGDQKAQTQVASSKLSAGPTVIPIGAAGGASPLSDRKSAFTTGSISEQQTVSKILDVSGCAGYRHPIYRNERVILKMTDGLIFSTFDRSEISSACMFFFCGIVIPS